MSGRVEAKPSRCRLEAELRVPARWKSEDVAASRLKSALRGRTTAVIADAILAELVAERPAPDETLPVLARLSDGEAALYASRLAAALEGDAVRLEEAQARAAAIEALRGMRARGAASGVTWHLVSVEAASRWPAGTANAHPPWHFGLQRIFGGAGPDRQPAGSARPFIAIRISVVLSGYRREVERALERDRTALEAAGTLVWCQPIFEERRRRTRLSDESAIPGTVKLPPTGARLLSLLQEIAGCLAAQDEAAAFTVARAFAIFAQSQPDVTRLLMRDPRSARTDDGFDADEPADVDFELQKALRALQHRRDLNGLHDLFCAMAPRMGILRMIEHRVRGEAELGGSPFHTGAFNRVFGHAENAALHLRAIDTAGLLAPEPGQAPQADLLPA